jgi:2-polyprenyl-6-methoxyphenol hydroxylase-like FAD-dependent oxidoreductase
MASGTYDIITVGGGLGGSTLAKAMAECGARVLVLEQETRFRDRIRGENIWCWGVVELKTLGVYELLRRTCACEIVWSDIYLGPLQIAHRDLLSTTLPQLPDLNFYHPAMQEVLLQAAAEAGAEVRRGARACAVQPGAVPTVTVEHEGRVEELCARLVVCADGRTSLARKWAGFAVHRDLKGMMVASVLLDEMAAPHSDTNYLILNPPLGQAVFLGPLGQNRVRAYVGWSKDKGYRLQGESDLPRFVAESAKATAPAEWYAGVKVVGPLATFDGRDTWVEHPYREGVVLVGDAAAASDPSYGQGLSLTVRDVRMLRDCLLSHADWDEAGHAYAAEHDRYYGALHTATGWFWDLFFETGPEADARRAQAFPLIAQDPSRIPDFTVSGPEVPLDETVRKRFFGEE